MKLLVETRFDYPQYTQAEVARCVGVARNTIRDWCSLPVSENGSKPLCNVPLVTRISPDKPYPETIPFIGMAEAVVMTSLFKGCQSTKRLRPAIETVIAELDIKHPHASKRFHTAGAEIIYDYDKHCSTNGSDSSPTRLVEFRDGQHVFVDEVAHELETIQYHTDGYPSQLRLPGYPNAKVIANPAVCGGQPIFSHGIGYRVCDVVSLFRVGEPIEKVAKEYPVPIPYIQEALRVEIQAAHR